jgi:hypothetical protein
LENDKKAAAPRLCPRSSRVGTGVGLSRDGSQHCRISTGVLDARVREAKKA